ncbi:MAG TPA: hypothetical protein VMU56_03190 [Beijerinckiaceae bacterium]|nr:hypothetical protein [Beijerinckiaceae bacterium]
MLIKIVVAFVGALAVVSAAAAAPVFGWWITWLASLPAGLLAMHGALQSVFSPRPIPPHYERRTGALLTLAPQRFRDNAQDVVALKGFVKTLAPRLAQIIAPTALG